MDFLIIVPLALYMLFVIPAFMFMWEDATLKGIGCSGLLCVIVGFPGTLLALILKPIVKSHERSRRTKQDKIWEKERAEKAAKKAAADALVRNEVKTLFEKLRPDLYVATGNGLPSRIILHGNYIQLISEDGTIKNLVFSAYDVNVKYLPLYNSWWTKDGDFSEPQVNQLEVLANYINQSFHDAYYVRDHKKESISSPGRECEMHHYFQEYVEMNINPKFAPRNN